MRQFDPDKILADYDQVFVPFDDSLSGLVSNSVYTYAGSWINDTVVYIDKLWAGVTDPNSAFDIRRVEYEISHINQTAQHSWDHNYIKLMQPANAAKPWLDIGTTITINIYDKNEDWETFIIPIKYVSDPFIWSIEDPKVQLCHVLFLFYRSTRRGAKRPSPIPKERTEKPGEVYKKV